MSENLSVINQLQTAKTAKDDNKIIFCLQRAIDTQNIEEFQACLDLGIHQIRFADTICSKRIAEEILTQNWCEGWSLLCHTAVKEHEFSIEPLLISRTHPSAAQILIDAALNHAHANPSEIIPAGNLWHIAHLAIHQNNPSLYDMCEKLVNAQEEGENFIFSYNAMQRITTALEVKRIWPFEKLLCEKKDEAWYRQALEKMVIAKFTFSQLIEFEKKANREFPNNVDVEIALLEVVCKSSDIWGRETWEWAKERVAAIPKGDKKEHILHEKFWFISERLFTENVINPTQTFNVLDKLINLLMQSSNTDKLNSVIEEIVEQTESKKYLQILRHISQNYPHPYQQCFMQLRNQYPFYQNCEYMLHKVDDYTDALIAQSRVQSPLIDQWRESVLQKKTLQENIGLGKSSVRKKM